MKLHVMTKAAEISEEESLEATGDGGCWLSDQMVNLTSSRLAIYFPNPVRDLEASSLLLAATQIGLSSQETSVLDQLKALLNEDYVAQAPQPVLTQGLTDLAYPSCWLHHSLAFLRLMTPLL